MSQRRLPIVCIVGVLVALLSACGEDTGGDADAPRSDTGGTVSLALVFPESARRQTSTAPIARQNSLEDFTAINLQITEGDDPRRLLTPGSAEFTPCANIVDGTFCDILTPLREGGSVTFTLPPSGAVRHFRLEAFVPDEVFPRFVGQASDVIQADTTLSIVMEADLVVVLDPGAQQSDEGAPVSLSIAVSDPEEAGLSFAVAIRSATGQSQTPADLGLSFDTSTGLLTGTPNNTAASGSPYAVTITAVVDGEPADSTTFLLTVTNPPPTLVVTPTGATPALVGSTLAAVEGEAVSLLFNANDPDGDPLTFTTTIRDAAGQARTPADLGLSFDPTTQLLAGTLPNTAAAGSPYTITATVADSQQASASAEITLVVTNPPPVAVAAGPNQPVLVGDTVQLDGSGSNDVDGDTLTFSWVLTAVPPGSTATLSDPTVVDPTFVVDVAGTYEAQLTVNDGSVDSAPDTVTITTGNSPPAADAGPDQTVLVTDTVTLDGSGSSDVDGNPLTFSWSLTSVPSGSAATLSDPTAVMPTFVVDVAGTYEAQLIVNDGTVDSAPDTVTITTGNSRPVAVAAGPNQPVLVGDTVQLDGSGSNDVDGNPLTFSWSLTSVPSGSAATLSDPTAVMPTFVVDVAGTYEAQLIVNDGTVDSAPDTVTITTGNSRPVAVAAGPNQPVLVGDTVQLDGSGSNDVDGDPLTFSWSLTSVPTGSAATLSDPIAVMPTFVVDVFGTYVAQLIVNDGTVDSAPDTVTITTGNSRPVANAGPNQTVPVDTTVQLDGSASFDVDGDPLTFRWALTTVPEDSETTLSDPTAEAPTFVADVFGTYVAQLIVNDGTVDSAPDTVTISVTTLADLVVTSFNYTGNPANVVRGSAVGSLISLTISNVGQTDAGSFFVGFYVSSDATITTADTLLIGGRESVSGLAAGASVVVPVAPADIPANVALGQAFLGVILDEFDVIPESDETNNTDALPINLTDFNVVPVFNFADDNQTWRNVGFYDDGGLTQIPGDFADVPADWFPFDPVNGGTLSLGDEELQTPSSPTGSAFTHWDLNSPDVSTDASWQGATSLTYDVTGQFMTMTSPVPPTPISIQTVLHVRRPDGVESFFTDGFLNNIPLGTAGGWTTHRVDITSLGMPLGTVILDVNFRVFFESVFESAPLINGFIRVDNVLLQ